MAADRRAAAVANRQDIVMPDVRPLEEAIAGAHDSWRWHGMRSRDQPIPTGQRTWARREVLRPGRFRDY